MTTGYYVSTPACPNACEHCSQSKEIHIGQTAGGWPFLFHAYPADNGAGVGEVKDFPSWLRLAGSGPITDEYGRAVTLNEMIEIILASVRGPDAGPTGSRTRRFEDAYGFQFASGEWS